MKSILRLFILSVYLISTYSYFDYSDIRRSLISHMQRYQSRKHLKNNNNDFDSDANSKYGQWVEAEIMRARPVNPENDEHRKGDANEIEDRNDVMQARQKALVLFKAKGKEAELNELKVLGSEDLNNRKVRYHMDPVFNVLRSGNWRRDLTAKTDDYDDDSSLSSSSQELGDFKEQFRELWLQKKYEALNSTIPEGDQVNMVAARK